MLGYLLRLNVILVFIVGIIICYEKKREYFRLNIYEKVIVINWFVLVVGNKNRLFRIIKLF